MRLLPVSTVLDHTLPGFLSSGITLLEANDFARWLFTIEVMGDSLYQVRSEHPLSCYQVLIINPGRGLHSSIQIRCTIPHFLPSRPVCSDRRKRVTYPPCSFQSYLSRPNIDVDIFLTLAARILQRTCKDNPCLPFQKVSSSSLCFSTQICASILGNEWSPVLSVIAVCVTLQSMLASCKVRSIWLPRSVDSS